MPTWNNRSPEVAVGEIITIIGTTLNDGTSPDLIPLEYLFASGPVTSLNSDESLAPIRANVARHNKERATLNVGNYVKQTADRGAYLRELGVAESWNHFREGAFPTDYVDMTTRSRHARWSSERNPGVLPGDIVEHRDMPWVVISTEQDGYNDGLPVFIHRIAYSGTGRREVKWVGIADTYTVLSRYEPTEVEPEFKEGDLVVANTDRGSELLKEFVNGRVMEYVRPSEAEPGLHLVRLVDGEKWPLGITLSDRDPVHVTSVMLHQVRPDHVEPNWADTIGLVLLDVHNLAINQDWCEQYEEQMKSRFGIEVEPREDPEHDWLVKVTIHGKVDPDLHIAMKDVFGEVLEGEGNISTSEWLMIDHTTHVTLTQRGEPNREDVETQLNEDNWCYEDITIESISDEGEA